MNNSLKLAEAMYTRPRYAIDWMEDFDPFTDANDDYAVLEWMRENLTITQRYKFLDENVQNYRIGDYARAALKALT